MDASDRSNFDLPHSGPLRAGVRRLQLAAVMAAEAGRADEAASHIEASIGIARSLHNEPYVISQLVRMSCFAITKDALERVMARVRLSGSQRAALAANLLAEERPDTIGRAMVGERCFGDGYFLPGGPMFQETHEKSPSREFLVRMSGLVDRARLSHLRGMAREVDVARLPLSKRLEASRRLTAELEAEPEINVWNFLSQDFLGKMLVSMMAPANMRAIVEDLRGFAKLRVTRTALAVEDFREAQKRLPESLDELVPKYIEAVPLDPFDGKPLRFKKRDKGYVVYSIDEDGTDHGGAGYDDEGTDEENVDIPFRVVR